MRPMVACTRLSEFANRWKNYVNRQCMYGKVEQIYAAHSGVKKFIPVTNESIEYAIYKIMFDLN